VLERAGLVMRGRDAQRRPRTLVAVPLKAASTCDAPGGVTVEVSTEVGTIAPILALER
jgi:hypothetical protein